MKLTFEKPVKLSTIKGKDRITVETSETQITQIIDSVEHKMVVVQTTNLPSVIVVEPEDYESEFTRSELVEKFKAAVQKLTEDGDQGPDKTIPQRPKSRRVPVPSPASQTRNA